MGKDQVDPQYAVVWIPDWKTPNGTADASRAGLGSLVDVTGIEPVPPCLQSRRRRSNNSINYF